MFFHFFNRFKASFANFVSSIKMCHVNSEFIYVGGVGNKNEYQGLECYEGWMEREIKYHHRKGGLFRLE